ncbi:hypothetical protein B4U79_17040 [Dinothrombium tinctorium]|uniref:IRS-type PTB domain-containing protein n=1 Tax=Dinothrombium tinctorium TaxID=1965070 RepID=A0A443Q8M9_9ACAR|nr:hypothetical protein B4U79_17040 [Dinothrombium tinctorium]
MERFPICFQVTEASERVGLRDHLQLVVFTRGLGVARVGDTECFILWPISVIRQYRLQSLRKSDCDSKLNSRKNRRTTVVTLEIGRRCRTGEGVFHFTTTQGEEIMRELKKAVSNWASYRAKNRTMSASRSSSLIKACNHDTCRLIRCSAKDARNRSAPCTPALSAHSISQNLITRYASKPFEMGMIKKRDSSECCRGRYDEDKDEHDYIGPQCNRDDDCDYVESDAVDFIARPQNCALSKQNLPVAARESTDTEHSYIELVPS